MDVSANRFPYEAIKIAQEIVDAHFVAFDFEMSGVAGRRGDRGKPSLQDYYQEIAEAAKRYQILQVGLTIVKEDLKKGRYVARPYNFNLSPLPAIKERSLTRDWSSNSGAVSFLSKNGFQFETAMKTGVHYLSRKEEQALRTTMIEEQSARSAIRDMTFSPQDNVLITHIRTSVQNWLAKPAAQREESLNIPGIAPNVPTTLNRYQVRLTHQVVRNEFTGLQTQGMGFFVRITAPTAEQQLSTQLVLAQEREQHISRAVGFRWIIEVLVGGNIGGLPEEYVSAGLSQMDLKGQTPKQFMSKLQEKVRQRKRVLFGHNCFTDLIYLYQCFIGDLPDTIEDFNEEMRMLFPAIMDTKHIASFGSKRWGNTSLEDVEKDLRDESHPLITIPIEYNAYATSSNYHEAGYDSLLTANIAIRLSAKMEREGKYQEQIKPSDFSSMLPAFGADDDGYDTAHESASHSRASSVDGFSESSEPIKTPTTAIKQSFDIANKADAVSSGLDIDRHASVVPVKRTNVSWKEEKEVNKLKKHMANTNIFSVLEGNEDQMPGQEEDLISFSSGSDDDSGSTKALTNKMKNGELMPRWEMDFWTVFGNSLQVNGSKEGIWKLR